jgi:hypothetical protein
MYVSNDELTIDSLARTYGVTYASMQRALRGVARRQGARARADVSTDELRELVKRGWTYQQISDVVPLSVSGVRKRLSQTG